MSSYMRSNKGFALLTMIAVFLIIVLLVVAITQGITVYSSISERMIRRARARYLAEAGINDAMLKMYFRSQAAYAPGVHNLDITTPDGTQTVVITVTETPAGSGNYTIKATAPLY